MQQIKDYILGYSLEIIVTLIGIYLLYELVLKPFFVKRSGKVKETGNNNTYNSILNASLTPKYVNENEIDKLYREVKEEKAKYNIEGKVTIDLFKNILPGIEANLELNFKELPQSETRLAIKYMNILAYLYLKRVIRTGQGHIELRELDSLLEELDSKYPEVKIDERSIEVQKDLLKNSFTVKSHYYLFTSNFKKVKDDDDIIEIQPTNNPSKDHEIIIVIKKTAGDVDGIRTLFRSDDTIAIDLEVFGYGDRISENNRHLLIITAILISSSSSQA